jgi:hypothetical protein
MAVCGGYVYHCGNSGDETEVLMEMPSATEGRRAISGSRSNCVVLA